MKLETGMYVRYKTIKGIIKIAKIKEIIQPNSFIKENSYFLNNNDVTIEKNIIKTSHNIIGLIEVGDIIEFDITDEDNYSIIGINFTKVENELELVSIKDMLLNDSAKLLKILTHEVFEREAYKV